VEVVGSVLGFSVNLSAGLGSIFDVIQGGVDTVFFNRILRDLQARLRLLRLFLNAAGVDPVD
jgi:hypothetical protein